jgi:uncharacterized protein involved in outer membrane biogenesis
MTKGNSSSLLKKVAIVFGSLFGLMVLAAIIVPLVVPVNKYKPEIIKAANEKLNGTLDIGDLGLSLWGRIKVTINGLHLKDAKGNSVVDVQDASVNIPLLSLLTGHPELRLSLVEPSINVIKHKDGKMNVMTLVKEAPGGAATGQAQQQAQGGGKPAAGGAPEVPAMVLAGRYTILLEHAKLDYKDEATGDNYAVKDLNFRLEDVSPSSNMPFELTANLDLLAQKRIKVTGPLVLHGEIKAHSSGGAFEKAEAKAALKLDGLEIKDPSVFNKAAGVPLGAELEASVGKDSFDAPKMKLILADVEVDAQASGKTTGGVTNVDFKAHSNRIDIAKLGALSPLVKEYGLNGLVELAVNANGPTDKLGYGANVKFNKIILNHEAMKQPLEVNGSLAVVTNALKSLDVKLTAKDFDLDLKGAVENFSAPRFKFSLASNNMDVDGLLKSTEKAAERRKEAVAQAAAKSEGAPSHEAPVVDYNAMFKPLHENPIFAAVGGTFGFDLKRIKATGVVISNMKGELALDKLLLSLKNFSLGIFDGTVKGNMSFNARTAKPEVATNLTVTGLETKKMVESQMPMARNTIKGTVSASLNIGGTGLNQSDIVSGWKGTGSFDIKNAVISTLDVGKQLKDGLIEKLPSIGGMDLKSKIKIPDAVVDHSGQYDTLSAKFSLKDGVLTISDLSGKAAPNKGLDLKGSGTVSLASYGLKMDTDIIDTYDMIPQAKEYAPEAKYGNHFAVSAPLGGTVFMPKFDWGGAIGKIAQNAGKKALGNAIQKQIPGGLPGGLGKILGGGGNNGSGGGNNGGNQQQGADAVKKAFKGLFGH